MGAAAGAARVPGRSGQADLFGSAWDAYVLYNRPYSDVFGSSRASMRKRSRGWTCASSGTGWREIRGSGSGTICSLSGSAGSCRKDEDLFVWYWEKAPAPLRKEVLTSAGWSLAKTETLESDVLSRLQGVWTWILEDASRGDSAPLDRIRVVAGHSGLEPGWLLDQALAVLQRGVYLEPDFKVYEAAAAWASDFPERVVRLIELMVRNDPEDWSLHGSVDEVRAALRAVLARGNEDAQRRAGALVDVLVGRGMAAFRELGSPPRAS